MAMRVSLAVVAVVVIAVGAWFALGGTEHGPQTRAQPSVEPAAVPLDVEPHPVPTSRSSAGAVTVNPIVDRSADAAAVRAGRCEFRVVQPDGAPAVGAQCALGRKKLLRGTSDCDANGVATFEPSEDEAWLIVVAPTRPMAGFVVTPRAGRHVVDLPDGAVVCGHVTVDGRPPQEPIVLRLSGGEPRLDAPIFEGWNGALFGRDTPRVMETSCRATTAPDGSFAFSGVPKDYRELHVAPLSDFFEVPLRVVERTHLVNVIPVDPASPDNLIELTRAPVWTGRVVRPTGEPVAGALVSTDMIIGPSLDHVIRTKVDGRFTVPVRLPTVVGGADGTGKVLSVTLYCADSLSAPVHGTKHINGATLSRDLGDVVLPAPTRITLSVRDGTGSPIAGARVGRPRGLSIPVPVVKSDAEGRLELPMDEFPGSLIVGAAGFHDLNVEIPEAVTDPIPLTLRRGGHIDVEVRRPDGGPERRYMVELAGSRTAFEDGVLVIARHLAGGANSGPFEGKATGSPNAEGQITFAGLVDGSTFTVDAVDPFGTKVASRDVALSAESRPTVVLTVSPGTRKFACRVFDLKGVARADASVLLTKPGAKDVMRAGRLYVKADVDAVYRQSDMGIDRVDVEVSCQGCGRLVQNGIDLTDDEEVRDFHLSEARSVEFEVVDSSGEPVVFEAFEASYEGHSLAFGGVQIVRREGKATVSGVSAGKLNVRVRVARTDHDFEFDTSQSKQRIVLDRPGQVLVHVDPPIERKPGERWMIELVRSEDKKRYSDLVARRDSDPTDRFEFRSVLPGRYAARLVRLVENRTDGSSSPVSVDVASGKQAEVTVKRP